jgi:CHAD domain-containing protein
VPQLPPRTSPFLKRLNAFTKAARRIDNTDVEAVHFTRVASRRLRELLPLLGLPARATQKLSRRLKQVTKRLGAVRELDVQSLMLDELGQDSRYPSAALQALGAAVNARRVAVKGRLAAKLPAHKLDRLARRLKRAVKQRESTAASQQSGTSPRARAWEWAIDARASRRATDVRAAIELAGSVYAPERLHDVRIAVKRLRYALELRAEARHRRGNRDIAALKTAQDVLGRLHDVEILIARARETQASLTPRPLSVWRDFDSLIELLEDDCRVLHARYIRDRASLTAIADRVHDQNKLAPPAVRRAAS